MSKNVKTALIIGGIIVAVLVILPLVFGLTSGWQGYGYGMMGRMMGNSYSGPPTADMPVTPEQAEELAQKWLEVNLPGVGVAETDTFYGYYTLHTLKGEQVEGMLSVNGYTGAVWYHNWHGPFITMEEFE